MNKKHIKAHQRIVRKYFPLIKLFTTVPRSAGKLDNIRMRTDKTAVVATNETNQQQGKIIPNYLLTLSAHFYILLTNRLESQ